MLSDTARRVPPPSRSKIRWQPYPLGSVLPACGISTPKPSAPPTPLPTFNNPPQIPKEVIQRDVGKQKYALGLIDQGVKTLSEIWRPEDIPSIFIGPSKYPTHLGSLVSTSAEMDSALPALKNFVHEVLKRSRTSGPIMQTALCYLEAIRPKVPEILNDEKLGIRSYFMPETAILPATEAELQMDRNLTNLEGLVTSDDLLKTVRLTDEDAEVVSDHCQISDVVHEPMVMHMSTASSLPSPLLCPRRTFLAALILASKFSQDKCYSNRAWAKLSGLPPREIGRCERALGQALDWRLWVGKKASILVSSQSRAVVRTQSESCINIIPSLREPFLQASEPKPPDVRTCPNLEAPPMGAAGNGKGLRRCSTAPTESFVGSRLTPTPKNRLQSQNDISLTQVFCTSSESIGSSTSSPETPPLSYSPSTSGDQTIQISSYEDGLFPSYNMSQSNLDVYSASPSSFLVDPTNRKLRGSDIVDTPVADGELSTIHLQMSLAEKISESLWSSRLGMVTGSHLWHADGGHLSLESAPVH